MRIVHNRYPKLNFQSRELNFCIGTLPFRWTDFLTIIVAAPKAKTVTFRRDVQDYRAVPTLVNLVHTSMHFYDDLWDDSMHDPCEFSSCNYADLRMQGYDSNEAFAMLHGDF